MKTVNSFVAIGLTFILCLSSCSSSETKEKSSKSNSSKVPITVAERSTTTGTQTTDELDKDIENLALKAAQEILDNGPKNKTVFSAESYASAKDDRELIPPDYSKMEKYDAHASIHFMNNSNDDNSLIVVDIYQYVNNEKTLYRLERNIKLFVDLDGKIIGFNASSLALD